MLKNVAPGRETSHAEGRMTRKIERETGKLSSVAFLCGAGASIVGSLVLFAMGRKRDAIFVGHWSPVILLLGLYNKFVKVLGSR